MISVREAHNIIRGVIPPSRATTLKSRQASGRVLAQDVRAPFPLPRFDNSSMDGFAVRWEDTGRAEGDHPVILTQVGTVPAGNRAPVDVEPGECAQVMTGAPIPRGADAVVMVEYTSGFSESDHVEIRTPVKKGENIRFKGEEIQPGERVLTAGLPIGPAEVGTLASFGISEVKVYRRPRVALVVTGSELKDVGETLDQGQIFNSNLPVLEELSQQAGAELVSAESLPDDPVSIRESVGKVLASCDILVSSGGVSEGRFDLVRDVFKEFQVNELFHKVAQKPGRPLFFGTAEGRLVFGLPGNPVAVLVCFMEYIWPTCQRWMGQTPEPKIEAILEEDFPRDPRKHRFLPGRVWVEGGKVLARPSRKLGSHMLSSATGANGILECPSGDGPLPRGESVLVNLLPWKSIPGRP